MEQENETNCTEFCLDTKSSGDVGLDPVGQSIEVLHTLLLVKQAWIKFVGSQREQATAASRSAVIVAWSKEGHTHAVTELRTQSPYRFWLVQGAGSWLPSFMGDVLSIR